jgi:Ca2+-binding RTX toxin-like protein
MRRVALVLALMAVALLLASGVAWAVNKVGTNGPDTLRGTNRADNLSGRGGDDVLLGLRGDDALYGGGGSDALAGGSERGPARGDRALSGGPGGDFVGAGRGSDAMSGGPGRDFLFDAEFREGQRDFGQRDFISGGAGDDLIIARQRPAARDIIDCGGGFDRALVDRKDLTSDCERLFFSERGLFEALARAEVRYYFGLLERLESA